MKKPAPAPAADPPKRQTDLAHRDTVAQIVHVGMFVDAMVRLFDEAARVVTNPVDVARLFVQLRDVDDRLDAVVKTVDKLKQYLSVVRLPEMFGDADMTTVSLADVGARVTLTHRTTASVLDADMAFEWLRANGFGDAIKSTVQSNTLARIVKEYSEEHAKDPPAEAIKVSILPYVTKNKL